MPVARATPEALRAGAFHLLFNLATAAVGVALIGPLAELARALGGDAARQLANAHIAFNVLGAAAVVLVLGPVARGLERLVPARPGRPTPAPEAANPRASAGDAPQPGREREPRRGVQAAVDAQEPSRYAAGPPDDPRTTSRG